MITVVAVRSFFESVFAEQMETRQAATMQLRQHLGDDFPEASFVM